MTTVVVCEDDADIRGLVVAALHAGRYLVREAGDVAGALAAIAEGGVGAVVTDLALPDGSGTDVCRAAASIGARVVVITAASDVAAGVAADAAVVLRKPFALADLLAALGADDGPTTPGSRGSAVGTGADRRPPRPPIGAASTRP